MKGAVAVLCLITAAASLPAVQVKDDVLPLANVKRIYVDQLGGGGQSDQLRDMIIAALQNSGLFIITENPAAPTPRFGARPTTRSSWKTTARRSRSECIRPAARATRIRSAASEGTAVRSIRASASG